LWDQSLEVQSADYYLVVLACREVMALFHLHLLLLEQLCAAALLPIATALSPTAQQEVLHEVSAVLECVK
jgi:hypothetical protein